MPSASHPQLRNVPVQARGHRRLAQLLEAGDRVLAGGGPARSRPTGVAAAAGVPVGSVYHYFQDKEAPVQALALRWGVSSRVSSAARPRPASAIRCPTPPAPPWAR